MEKILNYKVVDLVENYNFHIKFTSIRVQTKNYKFLKRDWTPTVVARGARRCYSTARLLPPRGTAIGLCHRPSRRQMYSFANFLRTIYFCKKRKKNVKKIQRKVLS
jgi:hypothetical protein